MRAKLVIHPAGSDGGNYHQSQNSNNQSVFLQNSKSTSLYGVNPVNNTSANTTIDDEMPDFFEMVGLSEEVRNSMSLTPEEVRRSIFGDSPIPSSSISPPIKAIPPDTKDDDEMTMLINELTEDQHIPYKYKKLIYHINKLKAELKEYTKLSDDLYDEIDDLKDRMKDMEDQQITNTVVNKQGNTHESPKFIVYEYSEISGEWIVIGKFPSYYAIGKKLGIHRQTISRIVKGTDKKYANVYKITTL